MNEPSPPTDLPTDPATRPIWQNARIWITLAAMIVLVVGFLIFSSN